MADVHGSHVPLCARLGVTDIDSIVADGDKEVFLRSRKGRRLWIGAIAPLSVGLGPCPIQGQRIRIWAADRPVELSCLNLQRHRTKIRQNSPRDRSEQKYKVWLPIQNAVSNQQADLIGRTIRDWVADDRQASVNVVPTRVGQDVGITIAAFPDVMLDGPLPGMNSGRIRGIEATAREASREKHEEDANRRIAGHRDPPPRSRAASSGKP